MTHKHGSIPDNPYEMRQVSNGPWWVNSPSSAEPIWLNVFNDASNANKVTEEYYFPSSTAADIKRKVLWEADTEYVVTPRPSDVDPNSAHIKHSRVFHHGYGLPYLKDDGAVCTYTFFDLSIKVSGSAWIWAGLRAIRTDDAAIRYTLQIYWLGNVAQSIKTVARPNHPVPLPLLNALLWQRETEP